MNRTLLASLTDSVFIPLSVEFSFDMNLRMIEIIKQMQTSTHTRLNHSTHLIYLTVLGKKLQYIY